MDVTTIPKRVTKAYLASLTEEEREAVEEYKKERLRAAKLRWRHEHLKEHRPDVNEYNRIRREEKRRQKSKEFMASVVDYVKTNLDDDNTDTIVTILELLASGDEVDRKKVAEMIV